MLIGGIAGVRPVGTNGIGGAPGVGAAAAAGGGDFTKILADVARNAMDAVKTGEATAISGINGNASVQQVVEAVMSAEQALQTAVAVRDKLVAAFQEVTRMAI
jgi:flagellar hook-basal body complex protein FliE